MPIRINTGSDRHTQFSTLSISYGEADDNLL